VKWRPKVEMAFFATDFEPELLPKAEWWI